LMPSDGAAGAGGATATGGSGGQTALDTMPADIQVEAAGDQGINTAADIADGVGGHDCATGGYQLCDDFEGVAAGDPASVWTVIKSGGYVVETVTTEAHSGTHSVHVTTTAGGGYGYIEETKTFPATDFWGRAYMRFRAPNSGHEVFVGADTNMNEGQGEQVRFFNNMGGGKIATNRRSDDRTKTSAASIPMGSWFCFEWHETPTDLHIFLDGKELTDAGEMWVEPKIVALVLGFERFGGGAASEVWIDDVAINAAQIGCN
jgi:hypothetical protein